MDLQLHGKVALVTGGSKGIGRAIARRLALEGCSVAIIARNHDALSVAAEDLSNESGRPVLGVAADTLSGKAVTAAVSRVVAELGLPTILVNCAASSGSRAPVRSIEDLEAGTLLPAIDVKVQGYVRCAKAVLPHMRVAGWGRIINIAGVAARSTGSPLTSIRNAAVVAMTKNLADEVGPEGINVSVVHPGVTETERTPATLALRAAASGRSVVEERAAMDGKNVIGRLITADEVADVVAFLASPRSVSMTGDVIAADGGTPGAVRY